jgi:DNA-binding NarL/FixJ family response regulator
VKTAAQVLHASCIWEVGPKSGARLRMNRMRQTRIVVADDHGLIREAIRLALENESDLEIVAEAERGEEVLPRVRETRPDVVLLDIRMPGMEGLEVLRRLRKHCPNVKVAMLSAIDEPDVAADALGSGAAAYLGKRIDPVALGPTIRQIADGTITMETFGLSTPSGDDSARQAGLSPRETQMLKRLAEGRSNREIARELWLSEHTVKYHLTNVYRKLGVRGRTEAARYAFEHALADRFSA